MDITGVHPVSSGAQPALPTNNSLNPVVAPGDSNSGIQNNVGSTPSESADEVPYGGGPAPLKGMSTADFLTLHNSGIDNDNTNLMNKLLKILEAVLALELLDKTLEAAQEGAEENNFKEIA